MGLPRKTKGVPTGNEDSSIAIHERRDKSPTMKPYQDIFWKLREKQRAFRNQRSGWWTFFNRKATAQIKAMNIQSQQFYERSMPKSKLPPIFPQGPLNLNPDGTSITYRKSHQGPHAAHLATLAGLYSPQWGLYSS